jgi:hypothetical protein
MTWTTLISRRCIARQSPLISVLRDENVRDDKSDISEEVDALCSNISRDNSLEV